MPRKPRSVRPYFGMILPASTVGVGVGVGCVAASLALGCGPSEQPEPASSASEPAGLADVGVRTGAKVPESANPEELRATMRRIFGAIDVLLPVALSRQSVETEEETAAIGGAVQELASAARQLTQHASSRDASFDFLSRSLSLDARAVQRYAEARRYPDLSYRVLRITRTCVACHSRLRSERKVELTQGFVERLDLEKLEPRQVALFEVAARQFDSALERYEKLLANPSESPASLVYSGMLTEYLIVGLRVRGDVLRVRTALERFRARDDLPAAVEPEVTAWIGALEELAPELAGDGSLERARAILDAGARLKQKPSDRRDLVHRVVASAILYRWVESDAVTSSAAAEAMLLLAETEAFVRRSFERSDAELYLEEAIRLAPGSDLARKAFLRLEEQVLPTYRGLSGLNLPPDVERRLDELRQLSIVEGNRAS